ncbi:hypothetical protein DFH08DRAFT_476484 [Mycena albidolilacea]|uniref:Uncharacterized protein n=1 Tax=Mycena albidolilacea TaxID=1033008 RepID=A0AAD7EXD8_9AGAR|nr:hypothetical protein DFH08DRAFT_476484 [Mycena albidolilacea]
MTRWLGLAPGMMTFPFGLLKRSNGCCLPLPLSVAGRSGRGKSSGAWRPGVKYAANPSLDSAAGRAKAGKRSRGTGSGGAGRGFAVC